MTAPIRADQVVTEKVNWLWRERIALKTITVIAGRPDQGKGLVSVHIGTDVSRSGGNVLHSAIEDLDGLMTKPRYQAAGADLKHVFFYRFVLPHMMNELEAYVREHDIDLIVMDPFSAHLRGVSKASDKIRDVLTPLSKMLEETNTALIIIDHALKKVPKDGHPLNAISGVGLPQAARMAYVFGVDPNDDDKRVMCAVKSNLRFSPKAVEFTVDTREINVAGEDTEYPLLLLSDEVQFDPMRLFTKQNADGSSPSIGRPPQRREEAAEWLTNYLVKAYKSGKHAVRSGLIFEDAKQHNMSAKTIRRAADDMDIVKNPPGGGPKVEWSLPDDYINQLGLGGVIAPDSDEPAAEAGSGQITDADLAALLGQAPVSLDEIDHKPGLYLGPAAIHAFKIGDN